VAKRKISPSGRPGIGQPGILPPPGDRLEEEFEKTEKERKRKRGEQEFAEGQAKGREILAMTEARRQALAPPLLATPGPRRRRRRAGSPFDFFGTLFSTPRTLALNSMTELNELI
jgi:hypothetical protein